jgi:hypothetical protein
VLSILAAPDWGDVPTTVGAIASLGALVAAVFAARAAFGVLQVERRRDADQDEVQRRRQAERLAAWPVVVPEDPEFQASEAMWGVTIRNASDLPVYQAWVILEPITRGAGEHITIHELVPPGTFTQFGNELRSPNDFENTELISEPPPRPYVIALEFDDAAGRRWRRDANGTLIRVERRPDPGRAD